jgi:hypothetical protein
VTQFYVEALNEQRRATYRAEHDARQVGQVASKLGIENHTLRAEISKLTEQRDSSLATLSELVLKLGGMLQAADDYFKSYQSGEPYVGETELHRKLRREWVALESHRKLVAEMGASRGGEVREASNRPGDGST